MQLEDTPNDKYKPQITQELFGWQYSSTGRVDGISTSVDLDLIYEDLEQNEAPKDYSTPYAEPTYTLYRGRLAQKVEYVKWLQWHLIKVGVLKSHTAEGKAILTDPSAREQKQHWWHSRQHTRKRTAPRNRTRNAERRRVRL